MHNCNKDTKYKRIVFYYDELTRHKVDYNTALEFMCYMFSVSREYLVQIIKNYHHYNKEVKLEHADLDLKVIDAFVQKLFREARNNRQLDLFEKK